MSWVYVFDFGDMVKVGFTTDLKQRQISVQCELKRKAVNIFSMPATIEVEAIAHKELAPHRIQGEYYACPFCVACAAVKDAARKARKNPEKKRGVKVKFTMVLSSDLAQRLDYIRVRHGRSRIKEIEWACREYIRLFEENVSEIEKEDA